RPGTGPPNRRAARGSSRGLLRRRARDGRPRTRGSHARAGRDRRAAAGPHDLQTERRSRGRRRGAVMAASKADASDPIAAEAAQQALDDGGRAADAAIAGFLAAAGAREAVLLAPTVALVGGLGAGTRLLDGRAVQPGAGAKRP